jgi:hypothetical protein
LKATIVSYYVVENFDIQWDDKDQKLIINLGKLDLEFDVLEAISLAEEILAFVKEEVYGEGKTA